MSNVKVQKNELYSLDIDTETKRYKRCGTDDLNETEFGLPETNFIRALL